MLVLVNWVLVKVIKEAGDIHYSRDSMLPNFDLDDYPFMLVELENSYDIIDIKTRT